MKRSEMDHKVVKVQVSDKQANILIDFDGRNAWLKEFYIQMEREPAIKVMKGLLVWYILTLPEAFREWLKSKPASTAAQK